MLISRQQERRRFPRVNLKTELHYKVRGQSEFGDALVRDISLGGAGVISDKYISPSTLLMLEINVLSRVLHPVGKVVSSFTLPHSERNHLGLEFLEIDPKEKNYMKDFINLKASMV